MTDMTPQDDLDRELLTWLDDVGSRSTPRNLEMVLERTRHMRQRPAWASLERWLPMTVISIPGASPALRLAWLLLAGLLIAALGSGAALIGSSLLTSTRTDDGRRSNAVIPQGGEALIAFGTLDDGLDGQKAGDIYTVRADGTGLRQLTDGPEWEADPAWSPDGTRIAFRSWDTGTDSVVVMGADGGNRMTLASSDQSSQDCLARTRLAWAPDASSIIFPTRSSCTGPYDLMIVATDGSSTASPLQTAASDSRHATWSPDGSRVAFLGRNDSDGIVGLYVAEIGPSRSAVGERISPTLSLGTDLGDLLAPPSWSPDGSTVAVDTGWPLSGPPTTHVMAADGSGEPLTIQGAMNPAWSPDGSQIAFQRMVDPSERFDNRPCTVRTWLADADGSNERMLDELGDGCDFGPAWSPDGTRLLGLWIDTDPANADESPFYLSVVTVDGSTQPVHVLDTGGASWQPVVPPPAPSPVAATSPVP
jgi:Tol biopolymer transport system component